MHRSILLVALAATLVAGCDSGPPDVVRQPLVVVGFDSADWTWIDERIAAGTMPHFASMVEEGVRADLLSLLPLAKSPTIWTSIATGKRPVKHGVAGFIRHEGGVERSSARTAVTYWEILGAVGRTQAVVGWWVTYPATPVNGVLVSDYIQYYASGQKIEDRAVYPPERAAEIDALRVSPEDITLDDLARFIDVDLAREHGEAAEEALRELKWIYAGDETFRRVARSLYETAPPDVFTVYFRGVDAVSHAYWQYFKPQSTTLRVNAWKREMLDELIPRYYDYADELLGEILGYVDPSSRIMVCSDHGFQGFAASGRGLALGVNMHDENGILLMKGPGIRSGARLERAEVKDLAPTLLAMAGIPFARDFDGHVLGEAFEPSFQEWTTELLTNAVDSYEGIVPRPVAMAEGDQEVDQEMIERLRALGYID